MADEEKDDAESQDDSTDFLDSSQPAIPGSPNVEKRDKSSFLKRGSILRLKGNAEDGDQIQSESDDRKRRKVADDVDSERKKDKIHPLLVEKVMEYSKSNSDLKYFAGKMRRFRPEDLNGKNPETSDVLKSIRSLKISEDGEAEIVGGKEPLTLKESFGGFQNVHRELVRAKDEVFKGEPDLSSHENNLKHNLPAALIKAVSPMVGNVYHVIMHDMKQYLQPEGSTWSSFSWKKEEDLPLDLPEEKDLQSSSEEEYAEPFQPQEETVKCPLCQVAYSLDLIANHASACEGKVKQYDLRKR